MTEEQLLAIEERANAATKGPWVQQDLWIPWLRRAYSHDLDYPKRPDPEIVGNDWEFIAHAREDVPALLAEVRRLQAISDDFQDAVWGEG